MFTVTDFNGEIVEPSKYIWRDSLKIFGAFDNLNIDFSGCDDITFIANNNCTFKTGSNCSFVTNSCCRFTTGDNCHFNVGTDCSFNIGNGCYFECYYDSYINENVVGKDCVKIPEKVFVKNIDDKTFEEVKEILIKNVEIQGGLLRLYSSNQKFVYALKDENQKKMIEAFKNKNYTELFMLSDGSRLSNNLLKVFKYDP